MGGQAEEVGIVNSARTVELEGWCLALLFPRFFACLVSLFLSFPELDMICYAMT